MQEVQEVESIKKKNEACSNSWETKKLQGNSENKCIAHLFQIKIHYFVQLHIYEALCHACLYVKSNS